MASVSFPNSKTTKTSQSWSQNESTENGTNTAFLLIKRNSHHYRVWFTAKKAGWMRLWKKAQETLRRGSKPGCVPQKLPALLLLLLCRYLSFNLGVHLFFENSIKLFSIDCEMNPKRSNLKRIFKDDKSLIIIHSFLFTVSVWGRCSGKRGGRWKTLNSNAWGRIEEACDS